MSADCKNPRYNLRSDYEFNLYLIPYEIHFESLD